MFFNFFLQPRDKAATLRVKNNTIFSGRIYMKIEFSSMCKPACASTFFTLNFCCLAWKLIDWHGRARVPDPVSWRNFLFCDHSFCTERFYSRGQHLYKFTKKSKRLQNSSTKEFDSHRICLEHQQRRHFIVLGNQYGRRDVIWKRSIRG